MMFNHYDRVEFWTWVAFFGGLLIAVAVMVS